MVQREILIIRGGMGYLRDSSEAEEERIQNETHKAQQKSLWIQISVLYENTLDLQTQKPKDKPSTWENIYISPDSRIWWLYPSALHKVFNWLTFT